MHRIGAEKPVEIARLHDLRHDSSGSDVCGDSIRAILGGLKPDHAPARIAERMDHRMDAMDEVVLAAHRISFFHFIDAISHCGILRLGASGVLTIDGTVDHDA